MKHIFYNASTKQAAEEALNDFAKKWESKYPYAVKSWRHNWDEFTVFYDFPVEIRKIIYTTNLNENLNGKIRKFTKSKISFPTDDAVKICLSRIKRGYKKMDNANKKLWNRSKSIYAFI